MLRNLAKGWYLCCLKHRRRNLKMKCEKQLLRDYSKQTYLICNFRQKRNTVFYWTYILSKAVVLMKLTKNLVIIAHSLWTRCSIKKLALNMLRFALTRPSPLLACACILKDPLLPVSSSVIQLNSLYLIFHLSLSVDRAIQHAIFFVSLELEVLLICRAIPK